RAQRCRMAAAAVVLVVSTVRAGEPDKGALPIIKVPGRVHLIQSDETPAMKTTLAETDIRRIFGEVHMVWAQARIQFEIAAIVPLPTNELVVQPETQNEFGRVVKLIPWMKAGAECVEVSYVKEIMPNGFYTSDVDAVVVKDTARLRPVDGGLDE